MSKVTEILKDIKNKQEYHKICILGEKPAELWTHQYKEKRIVHTVTNAIKIMELSKDENFLVSPYLWLSSNALSPYSVY